MIKRQYFYNAWIHRKIGVPGFVSGIITNTSLTPDVGSVFEAILSNIEETQNEKRSDIEIKTLHRIN